MSDRTQPVQDLTAPQSEQSEQPEQREQPDRSDEFAALDDVDFLDDIDFTLEEVESRIAPLALAWT
jgi:hypothetical protein